MVLDGHLFSGGGIHGIALVINHQWRRLKYSLPHLINWLLTFTCVVFLWVFFRAENIQDGWKFVTAMVNVLNIDDSWVILRKFLILCVAIGSMMYLPNTLELMEKFRPNKTWAVVIASLLIYSILCIDGYSEFLYFQF